MLLWRLSSSYSRNLFIPAKHWRERFDGQASYSAQERVEHQGAALHVDHIAEWYAPGAEGTAERL